MRIGMKNFIIGLLIIIIEEKSLSNIRNLDFLRKYIIFIYLNNEIHWLIAATVFGFTVFYYNIYYPNLYAFAQEITEKNVRIFMKDGHLGHQT